MYLKSKKNISPTNSDNKKMKEEKKYNLDANIAQWTN